MSKTANINVRIDPEFKTEVEDLYSSFGMSVTEAINIFLHMSVMEGGPSFRSPPAKIQCGDGIRNERSPCHRKRHHLSKEILLCQRNDQ